MDILLSYKNITDGDDIKTVKKFTHIKTLTYGDFTQYTYSIATARKGPSQFEDYIYSNNPILVKVISRGFSIIVNKGEIISVLEGPCKFSGKTIVDEDPEDDQDVIEDSNAIYDHKKIIKWSNSHLLEIIETEKANGKFVIFRAVMFEGKVYLHVGSKNKHLFFPIDQIDSYIIRPDSGDIVSAILQDVKKNLDLLTDVQLMDKFHQNYSLCGELCDGQHFMPGDNTVSWFGLFKSGKSMDTSECFKFIKSLGIQTVQWSLVYKKGSNPEDLEKVFLLSRCKLNEGSVLRCRNTDTNEIILVKTKSVSYITKRFMRQSILKGYCHMVDSVKKRFIDAQKYHGLNTNASIRICNQLVKFGLWLMSKEYPVAVLGVTQVNSIRGCLINGFSHYWTQYLTESGDSEQILTPDDFGDMDELFFSSNTEPYILRNYCNPVQVIFFQGLQGSGKSTIGESVREELAKIGKKVTIVEQDRFYGCTLSCQGYLSHSIKNSMGPDVILVTRCNANPTQFEKYLQICYKLPSVVTFAVPHVVDELYLAVCIEGVINRSNSHDLLLVGRKEFPIEEATNFIMDNYKDFKRQKVDNEIHIYKDNLKLQQAAKNIYSQIGKSKSNKVFIDWVKTNIHELHSIRNSISDLTNEVIQIIRKTSNGENLVLYDKPLYIGLAVQDKNRNELIKFIKTHNSIIDFSKTTTHVNYCTQLFIGGKELNFNDKSLCKPMDLINAKIDALVIRKVDGSCSFRIKKDSLILNSQVVKMNQIPHITGIIPHTEKTTISYHFIGLTDNTVHIVPMNYELILTTFYA